MHHHTYTVSEDTQGDFVLTKRLQREEARVNRLKRLQKSRITLGGAYPRWKSLLRDKCFKSHADVAFYLLDSFEEISSSLTPANTAPVQVSAPAAFGLGASSGTDSDDHLKISREAEIHRELEHRESFLWQSSIMKSAHESEWENVAAPVEWSENGNAAEQNGEPCESADGREESNSTRKSENGDEEADKGEELSTTFSVGDGQHTVDLGSPSELVVDETHLLQLFRSCRKCSRRCRHTKRLEGLKLVVSQSCGFCKSSCEWTNLSDADEDDDKEQNGMGLENGALRMNGNDIALSLSGDLS